VSSLLDLTWEAFARFMQSWRTDIVGQEYKYLSSLQVYPLALPEQNRAPHKRIVNPISA
jgi:hypothetical protein